MKICVIGPVYPLRGGIAHHTAFLTRELQKRHEVTLISYTRLYPSLLFPGTTERDTSRLKFAVECEPIFDPLNPRSWLSTARRIRALSPDLVIVQWWSPLFAVPLRAVTWLAKRRSRALILFICHNVRSHERLPGERMISQVGFAAADRFIVHSETDLRHLRAIRPDATIHKLFLPICEEFGSAVDRQAARRQLGISGPVILFFGLIRRYKGLPYLLQAMPTILTRMGCTLLIVGEFYEGRKECLDLIQSLNIAAHVRLIDRYVANEEVGLYFGAADLVVLPYISATQSSVITMAYAFDRPVVTTRVGGLPELVIDGRTGFTVDPADPAALADATLKFFRDPQKAASSEGIRRAREQFSWQRFVELLETPAL